jgi:hypothetical protein
MDFERNLIFFKTHKISYTGPIATTELEYGGHSIEIQSFGLSSPQSGNFW